jgi:hypothetical protein
VRRGNVANVVEFGVGFAFFGATPLALVGVIFVFAAAGAAAVAVVLAEIDSDE